ncbi:hypothetical protein MPDQ_004525 [Monascus purpureus]|uniref:Conidiation-specific protein 10 n=1 Tax=Monascus purpureus TaxID=5098 RepID=A0A507QKX3_MONPU|nr:hypothetical protein MPDQ_004525 [Monascus purpureus]BDD58697.1 hypothetical protein MAP00_003956 [Monascus purpureus]
MQRFLLRSTFSATRSRGLPASNLCRFHHPNPGNFQNRSKEQMSSIGRKGGRKGGKARGVGGFKSMDPEKQHAIASQGGHAARKSVHQADRDRPPSGQPSAAAPGFDESWTA